MHHAAATNEERPQCQVSDPTHPQTQEGALLAQRRWLCVSFKGFLIVQPLTLFPPVFRFQQTHFTQADKDKLHGLVQEYCDRQQVLNTLLFHTIPPSHTERETYTQANKNQNRHSKEAPCTTRCHLNSTLGFPPFFFWLGLFFVRAGLAPRPLSAGKEGQQGSE